MNRGVNHKIEVVVVDENGTSVKRDPFSPVSFEKSPLKTSSGSNGSISKAISAKMLAQAGSYFVSSYGDLTGDLIGQKRINEMMEVGGLIGMAATGPAGIAAALGAVAVKGINRYIDVKKSEISSRALKIRTGGSRHGD